MGVAIILEGQFGLGFEGGAPLHVKPGTVILHSTDALVPGWDEFKGRRAIRTVDIRFSSDAVRPIWEQVLLTAPGGMLADDASVPDRGAHLAVLPAWSGIARIAGEILSWRHDRSEIAALYLQGKANEALALTLKHVNDGHRALPQPADRRRLAEAYHRIQRHYADCKTVRQLAQAGVHTLLAGRKRETAVEQALKLQAEGLPVEAIQLDVTDAASIAEAVEQVRQRHGRLDILVNNAGIMIENPAQAPSEQSLDTWKRTFDTNVYALVAVTQAFLPLHARLADPARRPGVGHLRLQDSRLQRLQGGGEQLDA
ncbi:hypothetical protein G6F35_013003 [Rhizopus arrhizus]|nr:hypothetical protein G6F35_013003 [Rhizopus arrhizus]